MEGEDNLVIEGVKRRVTSRHYRSVSEYLFSDYVTFISQIGTFVKGESRSYGHHI
jgi:hypothetical protein